MDNASDFASSFALEQLKGKETSLHTLPQQKTPPHSPTQTVNNNTQLTITLPSPVVSQSSSSVLLLSPLVPQSSTPTQTALSDENSDTSTTSPTHKHVRTRGGRVRQATGRRIRTWGGVCGTAANSVHGCGVGAVRGHGGSRASWDKLVQSKRRFNFTSTPGVNILPEDSTSLLSILKMFLSGELIDRIVNFTNNYAEMMMSDPNIQAQTNTKQRSLFSIWKEMNRDEMWLYICVCLLIGIVHKPNIHAYSHEGIFSLHQYFIVSCDVTDSSNRERWSMLPTLSMKTLMMSWKSCDSFLSICNQNLKKPVCQKSTLPLTNIFLYRKDGWSSESTSPVRGKDMELRYSYFGKVILVTFLTILFMWVLLQPIQRLQQALKYNSKIT